MSLFKWWFDQDVSLYMATSMTGLTGYTIWKQYKERKKVYRRYGIKVNSPVPGEGIKPTKRKLGNRPGITGTMIWKKDKDQIKRSNVFVYPLLKKRSQGCEFELVKARGSHWKPTVYIHDKPGFISQEQSDVVCESDCVAARQIIKKFGSRNKRFIWRIKMLLMSLPKWLYQQAREFWL